MAEPPAVPEPKTKALSAEEQNAARAARIVENKKIAAIVRALQLQTKIYPETAIQFEDEYERNHMVNGDRQPSELKRMGMLEGIKAKAKELSQLTAGELERSYEMQFVDKSPEERKKTIEEAYQKATVPNLAASLKAYDRAFLEENEQAMEQLQKNDTPRGLVLETSPQTPAGKLIQNTKNAR